MNLKSFIGNLLGVCAFPFIIMGVICIITMLVTQGLILIFIGISLMLIAIYLHEKVKYEALLKEKESQKISQIETSESIPESVYSEMCEECKKSKEELEKELQERIDKRAMELVMIASILTDKRTNKETRAKKLKQYFKEDTILSDWAL